MSDKSENNSSYSLQSGVYFYFYETQSYIRLSDKPDLPWNK